MVVNGHKTKQVQINKYFGFTIGERTFLASRTTINNITNL